MLDWLWQTVVANAVWEVLLVPVGAAVFAYLRKRWPETASVVLYGALGAICVASLLFTFTGHGLLVKRQPEITQENVEKYVREWADSLGMGVTRMPEQDFSDGKLLDFGLKITLLNGLYIVIFREKDRPGYLQLRTPLVESREQLKGLTPDEADAVIEEVTLELSRTKMGFEINRSKDRPNGPLIPREIILIKTMPIDNALTEATFAQSTDEMNSAVMLVKASTSLTLRRYAQSHKSSVRQQ